MSANGLINPISMGVLPIYTSTMLASYHREVNLIRVWAFAEGRSSHTYQALRRPTIDWRTYDTAPEITSYWQANGGLSA